MNYSYDNAIAYCKSLGLVWIPQWVDSVDIDAHQAGFTQEQLDLALRHYLYRVHCLFAPQNYRWYQRIILAGFFLFGRLKAVDAK